MIFPQILKSIFGKKGVKTSTGDVPGSKVHYTYSLNGDPALSKLPFFFQRNIKPSKLDLDGKTPKKYLDPANKPK